MTSLPILHFNDVYRVTPQKVSSKFKETIDVTKFAALVDDRRNQWSLRANDGKRDGLLLFSGDVFSPSVESSVTRGSHMVPVLNSLNIDVSVTGLSLFALRTLIASVLMFISGNHDFDFGYPHLSSLIKDINFDIDLAKELFALSPSGQSTTPIASEHGVDLILGGHDHLYFVGRGVTSWDGFDVNEKVLGAESDAGDVLVIKSGSDFRDLSEINLELIATPEGSARRRVISKITGKRHTVKPGMRSSEPLAELLKDLLSSVSSALKAAVCKTEAMIDVRSYFIRVQESPVANWFADIARYAYDDTLCMRGCGGSDGVLLCAGTFRGDSTYGPGPITIGDILEILPFEDPIVVLEVDGATLWDALESSLRTWPAQEGRFPAVSGFRVSWDSRKEPGNRLLGIWVLRPNNGQPDKVEEEEVKRETDGRKYRLVTREYMAQGHDGFLALTRGKWLIDHECGSMLSTIVRRYFLGSQFVNKMLRLQDEQKNGFLNIKTKGILEALYQDVKPENSAAISLWKQAVGTVIRHTRSGLHDQQCFNISATEHMSSVDAFDGGNARKGHPCAEASVNTSNEDLLVVHPVIDGRLKDEGKVDTS
ncbi:hypothetical protein NLJ89_g1419 [Agrocybe chaxingu]|uniref:5'-Nucleotidase C-terminal domain-containing protein n=1 Tax=Agrocybe chaxingu TaxID=84603 RepID=A0A9W8N014_9AGAR|nr:hypothetical protein NLJ89_g1419 [Agrocybe chaxingu]